MTERTFEEIAQIDGFLTPGHTVRATIKVSHVHDCEDGRGLKLAGSYTRLTMTDAGGHAVSMLWSDEHWRDLMRDLALVADYPTAPDTHKEPA